MIFLVALGAVIHFMYNMPSWTVVILTYFLKGQEQATEKTWLWDTFPPNHYHPSAVSLFQLRMILQYVAKQVMQIFRANPSFIEVNNQHVFWSTRVTGTGVSQGNMGSKRKGCTSVGDRHLTKWHLIFFGLIVTFFSSLWIEGSCEWQEMPKIPFLCCIHDRGTQISWCKV